MVITEKYQYVMEWACVRKLLFVSDFHVLFITVT